ncbi:MAG: hypothetical protein K0S37_4647 [Microbacterium sp.]|nr:hypothetical protein [Microbacterium sp.]
MSIPDETGGDGLREKVTRSIGWVVLERWGSRFLQLAVFALLARLIDPSLFGIIALATAVLAILQVVIDSGFSKALIQLKELDEKDASTAFWTSIAISVVLYAALFFSAPLIAGWFGEPALAQVLLVLGLSLPIAALSQTPTAMLERSLNFRVLSLRQLVAATAGAIVAVPLALLGTGVWALVAQTLTTLSVACVILWLASSWRPKFVYSWQSLKRLWPIGASIMATELLDAVQNNIDKVVIGIFFSADILGYYYLAQRLGTILMELVTTVMARVSLTTFSRVQDDLPRFNRIFRQMTFAAGLIGVPVFGLTALLAPQIVPALFGPGWEESIPILWGLAAGWSLAAVMYFDRAVLLARRKAAVAFWVAAAQNAVGVILVFALLPLGITGVVISRWARVFVWPVRLWAMKRAIGLPVGRYVLQVAKTIAAFVPVGIGVALLQFTPWAQAPLPLFTFVIPVSAISLVVYGALAWWMAGKENRAVLAPILGGVLKRLPSGRKQTS